MLPAVLSFSSNDFIEFKRRTFVFYEGKVNQESGTVYYDQLTVLTKIK